jgi:mRNA interferase RelE/StbE
MYQVNFTPTAESDLSHLDKPIIKRVLKKLHWLAENFETITPEKLSGEFKSVFKLRVGDYRILYTFNRKKQQIIVHFVRHRREIYKTK